MPAASRPREGIRVFEDRAFQRWMLRCSAAIALGGFAVGILWFALLRPRIPGLAPMELTRLPALLGDIGDGSIGALAALACVLAWALGFILAMGASFAAHEALHALPMELLAPAGARVRIGVSRGSGMLYACAEGVVYTRRRYQLVIAAPCVLVTAALLACGELSGWPLSGYVLATIHLTGCAGDLGYLRELALDRTVVACEDTSYGVRFLRTHDLEEAPR